IGVFQQDDADHYRELARVPTAPGAKTGILVPEMKRLFVAVSAGEGRTGAAILRFEVAPAQRFYRLEASAVLKSPSPEWDYVTLDERRGYLFIGRRADGVTVYDVKAGRVVRTIANSDDANAVTLVPEFDRGYTTNGDGSTTAFRLSTLEAIERIKLGEDADSGFYDPVTKQIAFTMGDSSRITFVEAKTGKTSGVLPVDSKKLDGAAADAYRLSEATTTRPYARTMALDSKTKKVYLVTAEGTADPQRKINRGVAPFYPNRYFSDTFTILTFALHE